MRRTWLTGLCFVAGIPLALAGEKLTYPDLVRQLYDLEGLSMLPPAGERCAQWSSYDRKSVYDEATGKYAGWDANGDGRGIIREEDGLQVLAEMKGPGCIRRIWSARPEAGRVKIYLDGAAEPALDLPFKNYFDGETAPFNRSALVHVVAKGCNNYTPIPYAKSCRIVAEKGWGNYFQFNYTTFPEGTEVPTFRVPLSAEDSAALDKANMILLDGGRDPAGVRAGAETVKRDLDLAPGQAAVAAEIAGARAITALRARVDWPPETDLITALRELAVRISWDGEATPSVWAPFGDFFGTAAGTNAYRSLPLGLTADGTWYCHWYMPFAKGARVELVNDGAAARKVSVEVVHAPLAQPAERYARLHVKWHRDALLPAEPERRIDWTLLKTAGAGRFCGVLLHVWNPRGGWWGEGDEKFFVDGEKFPSTIGTGSEDYFGYAWCCPELFQNAFHNQTISMGNRGHVAVNRWHIPENIPFEKSFEGAIEKYFANERPTLYAATAWWYLAPGGTDPYEPRPLTERTGYWTPIAPSVKVPGAVEGEALKVLSKSAGNPHRQDMDGFNGSWSDDAHLWWTGAKPGDRLELELPVAKAGRYAVSAQLTKAKDYGIVKLFLDGRPLGDAVDLYNPEVVPTGRLDWGTHALAAGPHKLAVEITGANPKAIKAYMFGLDFVALKLTGE